MKTIIIRTLSGKGIGYGHYFRCLSLAKAIKSMDENANIIFLINEELVDLIKDDDFKFAICGDLNKDIEIIEKLNIDLFIFDSYLGNDEYLKRIKRQTKLMLIDDNNDIYDSSIPNIIYNGNIHAEKLGYTYNEGQVQLLGSKYLIMKEEYWNGNEDTTLDKEGILITTGGTDENGITINILHAIKDLEIKIKVIIGPGYKKDYIKDIEDIKNENIELIYKPNSLKEYIADSKYVITACGSTVYEVLSQKSIPIIFSLADNQDLLCRELRGIGIEYLGKYPSIEYIKLMESIIRLKCGSVDLDNRTLNLVRGDGALLVSKVLLSEIIY